MNSYAISEVARAINNLAQAQEKLATAAIESLELQRISLSIQAGHLKNAEDMIHGLQTANGPDDSAGA